MAQGSHIQREAKDDSTTIGLKAFEPYLRLKPHPTNIPQPFSTAAIFEGRKDRIQAQIDHIFELLE